eukprot:jgi/Galph1/828/GphlegSOOS_G5469.1
MYENNEDKDNSSVSVEEDSESSSSGESFGPIEDVQNYNSVENPSLPLSHEAIIEAHKATVSSISIEPSGVRMATASNDTKFKLWDFPTMTQKFKNFASLEPLGAYPLSRVEFSPTGAFILVVGGSSQAKVLSRDGDELAETPKGDIWHPKLLDTFATSSEDGTVRIWTLNAKKNTSVQKHVLKVKSREGKKNTTSAFRYGFDGKRIICCCDDGSLKIFDPNVSTTRPVEDITDAHNISGSVGIPTDIQLTKDDLFILTRNLNDAMFLWDCRRLEEPLAVFHDLPNNSRSTRCSFSTDTEYFCTSTSSESRGSHSTIVFFSRATMRKCYELNVPSSRGSAVSLSWPVALNQIIYGTSLGKVVGLYSPEDSRKGLLLCVSKPEKRVDDTFANIGAGEVFLPNALPMYQTEFLPNGLPMTEQNKKNKLRKDPVLTKKPLELSGPRPDLVGKTTLSSYMMQSRIRKNWIDEDPRESLLRYQEEAKSKPVFTGRAYEHQDSVILSEKTAEQEQEEQLERLKKRKLPTYKK